MASPEERRRHVVVEPTYLIRYGVMGHVGRFRAAAECGGPLGRGQLVVIRTDRGVELGEVLVAVEHPGAMERAFGEEPAISQRSRVLRLAGPDDLASSQRAEAMRHDRFLLCRRILEDEQRDWPGELIDVEMTLDDQATVLHYLGPQPRDAAAWRARFRMTCDFDVLLEPVGVGRDEEAADAVVPSLGDDVCGSCGRSGGGCGSQSAGPAAGESVAAAPGARGCGSTVHSGCASCGISRLLAARGAGRLGAC
jgi:hypothetical protein